MATCWSPTPPTGPRSPTPSAPPPGAAPRSPPAPTSPWSPSRGRAPPSWSRGCSRQPASWPTCTRRPPGTGTPRPGEVAPALWEELFERGAAFGVVPVGLGGRDTLRLEMGYALHGNDISTDTDPF